MQDTNLEITNLVNHFQAAHNIKNFKWESKIYKELFFEWLKERAEIRKKYIELLDNFSIDFRTPDVAEIGKSSLDSIALADSDTSIITPYSKEINKLNNNNKRYIIPGTLRVYRNHDLITAGLTNIMLYNQFQCYMTQNPYNISELRNWHHLDKRGKNIIVGVYGSIKEKDSIRKIKTVEALRNLINKDQVTEAFDVTDEYYTYAISTKRTKTE